MSTGESLIWIAIIGGIIYGLYLVHKKKKWKAVFKIFGVLIALCLLISGGVYAYNYYKNIPTEVNSLADLTLGMKEVDVTLIKGSPDRVDTNDEGIKMISYQDYSGTTEILVSISPSEGVTRICSFEFYDEVFGLGEYDSYDTVKKKLGEPQEKSINSEGTSMIVTYPQYNVAFGITENKVDLTCVTAQDRMSFVEEYSN